MDKEYIEWCFGAATQSIDRACNFLESLILEYGKSDLAGSVKLGRIEALRSKIDYLKGLKLDPKAAPWGEDD